MQASHLYILRLDHLKASLNLRKKNQNQVFLLTNLHADSMLHMYHICMMTF